MKPDAFVVMPFGVKERIVSGATEKIDFDRVYGDLIRPALEHAGFVVVRADDDNIAGNIRRDMFQRLLLADLVVADLSIDNPNVWYELGVRHALRSRGVVLIHSRVGPHPFDVYTDRKLRYHLRDGAPDPDKLGEDTKALAEMAKNTLSAWHSARISPVFYHLPTLAEPDWKTLMFADKQQGGEIAQRFDDWASKLKIAALKRRPGDIMVLADEAPIQALSLEAYRKAAETLMQQGSESYGIALKKIEQALALNPEDTRSLQLKAVLLGRTERREDAEVLIDKLLEAGSIKERAEAYGLKGRVEKESWIAQWRKPGLTAEQKRTIALNESALLDAAIDAYREGFLLDPANYYPGINVLTLTALRIDLRGEPRSQQFQDLLGAVRWAIQSALRQESNASPDYWARASFAELAVIEGDASAARNAWAKAVQPARSNWFDLDSSRQQLLLLQELSFQPEAVTAGLDQLNKQLQVLTAPMAPEKVFLFSGHMIDKRDRPQPRFPADKEPIAAAEIAKQLDKFGASANDLAICGGACGGDILFAEACLARGMRLQLHLQFAEPEFLKASVSFAGEDWVDRYFKLKESKLTTLFVQSDELGAPPKDVNPYVRNNLWQLYTALGFGPQRVRFITLWNGKEGDGPGGTKHMIETVQSHSGRIAVLDTTKLW
jgi:tetratricopeptide (TPR) repeat protein